MSIQEKKSSKGTSFAIVKFSDNTGEFELFLFSEMLTSNREKLRESESFVLTLIKDRVANDSGQKRVNVRKILGLSDLVNKTYDNVCIELRENSNIDEIKGFLKEKGSTKIKLIINDKDRKLTFNLENSRKFDLNTFNIVKNKEYVKKITF